MMRPYPRFAASMKKGIKSLVPEGLNHGLIVIR
jgi:hypothetical protein